ncbi:hypothetical protein NQZ68_031113 [Dissostichus eleginoides]|nr:hypothetical protein NQZ68_031113 [Dissostichus eleginoides]
MPGRPDIRVRLGLLPSLQNSNQGVMSPCSQYHLVLHCLIIKYSSFTNTVSLVLVSGEGEESVSSPEPPLDDQVACGRTRRRNKRIRTCFRSEQLRALESYFAHKHNPDGKDWNFLAQNTGLPKRVLQVWFQNARAKLRRSLTADDSQPFSSTSTIDQLQLSLLTAPLNEPPLSPAASQLQNPAFFLDYDSQSAPGCVSSLEAYEDFGEAERAEAEVDSDSSFRPHFC